MDVDTGRLCVAAQLSARVTRRTSETVIMPSMSLLMADARKVCISSLIASRLSAYDFFLGAQELGIAVGAVYSPEEAYEDPHFVDRGFQVEVEHPELGRTIRYPGAPYKLPASPWAISRRAPQLGEHDHEIFEELDLDAEIRAEIR